MKLVMEQPCQFVKLGEQQMRVIDGSLNRYVAQNTQLGGEDNNAYIVADLGDIQRKVEIWREALPYVKPFYAVKCNNDQTVVNVLEKCGLGFDCASKAEITQILSMGVAPERIIYANPCKQRSHLKFAANNDVSLMTFDNESELYKIKSTYPDARCVLRILPPVEGDAQCPLGMKFGCPVKQAEQLLLTALKLQLNVMGVSFHVGSGCTNAVAFSSAVEAAREVFDTAEVLGFHMTLLDIGGGFPGQPDTGISFKEICDEMCPVLEALFPPECGVEIIAEPGRFFVASAFTLAVNIINRRQELCADDGASNKRTFRYYVNDGVYGSFNCLLFDHAVVEPLLVERSDSCKGLSQLPRYPSSVWGPTCDGLDCLHSNCLLPELRTGDWLMYANMGAYTLSAATAFNGMPAPQRCYVIRREMIDESIYSPVPVVSEFTRSVTPDSGVESGLDCVIEDECLIVEEAVA